jgi:cytochrome c-type biogenesis protein CcmH/NrfF
MDLSAFGQLALWITPVFSAIIAVVTVMAPISERDEMNVRAPEDSATTIGTAPASQKRHRAVKDTTTAGRIP